MGKNNLGNESSPYLLQHAQNPVDWHAWNEEALDRAKKENKPIFLSVGYSSCHWCHVMAHESFEDEERSMTLKYAQQAEKSLRAYTGMAKNEIISLLDFVIKRRL